MSEVFLKIVNMSISAGWLILAVLLCRLLLRKAPKWVNVLLWGIVAVRALLPFSIESALSLIPSAETISPDIMMDASPTIHTGISSINSAVNPVISQSFAPSPGASANPLQIWIPLFAIVWVLGAAGFLVYAAISYWRLRRKVSTAVRLRDNIFWSENVFSPFVLGIISPKIYLPFKLDGQDMEHVIAHELAHIDRRDHWWKPLGFLILAVHWFNPLMWLSYVLLCRDIELACDEKVIRELDNEHRADYTQALLACSVSRRVVAACPLAFGEVGVKERVKSVMDYKKPSFWGVAAAVIICALLAVCFLTDPLTSVRNPWIQEYVPGTGNIIGNVNKERFESISDDFAIGADRYGRAVFKEPYKAFDTFTRLYADGIALIQKEYHLIPISRKNYAPYELYGWQTTSGSGDAQTQAQFVSSFLDIYENSFSKDIPLSDPATPTDMAAPTLSLNDVITLSQKGYDLSWADFEKYDHVDIGSGLYIWSFEIDSRFSLRIGGGSTDTEPMYIRLRANDASDAYIDIRDGGVAEFIKLHEKVPYVPEPVKYYLTVGADGVTSIELSAPNKSGGCQHADGSPFRKGEDVWLDSLDGFADLRGVTITALNGNGEIVWLASIPDGEENRGFTCLIQDGWTITNIV